RNLHARDVVGCAAPARGVPGPDRRRVRSARAGPRASGRGGVSMAHRGTEERDVVAGIFPDQEHASDAITRLIDNHFEPSEEISVLLADPKTGETREADARDDIQNYSGAKLGGGIGAALGATGAGLVGAGLIGGPVGLVAAGPV